MGSSPLLPPVAAVLCFLAAATGGARGSRSCAETRQALAGRGFALGLVPPSLISGKGVPPSCSSERISGGARRRGSERAWTKLSGVSPDWGGVSIPDHASCNRPPSLPRVEMGKNRRSRSWTRRDAQLAGSFNRKAWVGRQQGPSSLQQFRNHLSDFHSLPPPFPLCLLCWRGEQSERPAESWSPPLWNFHESLEREPSGTPADLRWSLGQLGAARAWRAEREACEELARDPPRHSTGGSAR